MKERKGTYNQLSAVVTEGEDQDGRYDAEEEEEEEEVRSSNLISSRFLLDRDSSKSLSESTL